MAKFDEVLHDLDLSVKWERTAVVIKNGLDVALTVALIQELFNLGPVVGLTSHVELKQFAKGLELESPVVVFAFLKDSNSKGLLDEILILTEFLRENLNGFLKGCGSLFWNGKGGLFLLDELK